jgi:penicillin-binding protein 2
MLTNNHGNMQDHRYFVVMAAVFCAFLVLVGKLYLLQIVDHERHSQRSRQNAMRRVSLTAARGRILDRTGKIIVGNRPAYTVAIIPAEVKDLAAIDSVLAPVLSLKRGGVMSRISKRKRHWHRPVEIKRDTPFRTIAWLEENRHAFPGVIYLVESRRRYPYKTLAAHLLGYVGEIPESQLRPLRTKGYLSGDLLGQTGIEAVYEDKMRGTKGRLYQEVTATGQVVHAYREAPVRGADVRLTIDIALQDSAERFMRHIPRGALIAMDPRSGEILAMVSRPTYSPSVFSFVVPRETWRKLNNPSRPLFNRAVMGTYPPGSIAKMITAIAALEDNQITPTTRLHPCIGSMRYGDRFYRCWASWGHGSLNLTHAIEQSCNVYFYQLGEKLGMDKWSITARKFGLGQATGVDLPVEDKGIVASTEVYNRLYGKFRWGRGEKLNVAIGQGITLVTPLQIARYVSAIATGKLTTPHLAASFVQPDGTERLHRVPDADSLHVRPRHLRTIRKAMRMVTEGAAGTGKAAWVPGYHVAAKTGTAQNPHGASHSWFVAYAPVENPEIAVTVLCENMGGGSVFAAPIAGRLLRTWFARKKKPRGPAPHLNGTR